MNYGPEAKSEYAATAASRGAGRANALAPPGAPRDIPKLEGICIQLEENLQIFDNLSTTLDHNLVRLLGHGDLNDTSNKVAEVQPVTLTDRLAYDLRAMRIQLHRFESQVERLAGL